MYVDGCRVLVVFVAGCWRARLVSMDLVTFWLLTWYLSLDVHLAACLQSPAWWLSVDHAGRLWTLSASVDRLWTPLTVCGPCRRPLTVCGPCRCPLTNSVCLLREIAIGGL